MRSFAPRRRSPPTPSAFGTRTSPKRPTRKSTLFSINRDGVCMPQFDHRNLSGYLPQYAPSSAAVGDAFR
jgi:hypothetical protein